MPQFLKKKFDSTVKGLVYSLSTFFCRSPFPFYFSVSLYYSLAHSLSISVFSLSFCFCLSLPFSLSLEFLVKNVMHVTAISNFSVRLQTSHHSKAVPWCLFQFTLPYTYKIYIFMGMSRLDKNQSNHLPIFIHSFIYIDFKEIMTLLLALHQYLSKILLI